MFHTRKIAFIVIMASLFLLFSLHTVSASAFRCGNHLVSIGDRSFEVLKKCGEPIFKEQIGYTITEDEKRELKVEEWIYGPQGGHYYHLIFEGNKLVKIKSIRE